ncbi:MAG: dephospho-CoA kinase [Clostridia bacterium]
MKIIGITGSSGSGKSTITNILGKELKAKTIYADKVVEQMQKKGMEYFNKIIELFGTEILNEIGELNRPKLAEIIFTNSKKREELNELTKQYVVEEIKKQIQEADEEYVIIDVPLLIETGLNEYCDIVIVVISNINTQTERICKRDNISKDKAIERINSQPSNEFYKKYANYIVENNGGNYDEFVGRIRTSLQKLQ